MIPLNYVSATSMQEILELCQKHNVAFGTSASGIDAARQWVERGAVFFEVIDELALIRNGATQVVGDYRRMIQRAR